MKLTKQQFISVLREPPFVIKESGYAGFEIMVDFYFKGLSEKDSARRARVSYDLFLTPNVSDLKNRTKEMKRTNTFSHRKTVTLMHKDQSFIKRLIKGGGILRSAPKSSSESSQSHSSSSSSKHSLKTSKAKR